MAVTRSTGAKVSAARPIVTDTRSSFLLPVAQVGMGTDYSTTPRASEVPPVVAPDPVVVPMLFGIFPGPSLVTIVAPAIISPTTFIVSTANVPPVGPIVGTTDGGTVGMYAFIFVAEAVVVTVPVADPDVVLISSLVILASLGSFSRRVCRGSSHGVLQLRYSRLFRFHLPWIATWSPLPIGWIRILRLLRSLRSIRCSNL